MLSRPARVLRRWPNIVLRSQAAEHASPLAFRALATAAPAKPPSPNDPFANGTNAYYVEEMYRLWRQDPKSVHVSWDVYFTGMDKKGLSSPQAFQPPPSVVPMPAGGAPALHSSGGGELDDHLKVSIFTPLSAGDSARDWDLCALVKGASGSEASQSSLFTSINEICRAVG